MFFTMPTGAYRRQPGLEYPARGWPGRPQPDLGGNYDTILAMSQLGLADSVAIPDAVVSRDLGGETVILNLETGIYFDLDGVATDIWQALQGTGSLNDAYQRVLAMYEVDAAVLTVDFLRLVNQMAAKGLLQAQSAA